jgi:hypothetical protein
VPSGFLQNAQQALCTLHRHQAHSGHRLSCGFQI